MTSNPLSARSGSERPGIALLVAVVVLPLVMGLLLMWGLATPALHLDRVSAAIVNDDVPITINGTTSPLGRQFAAGLIAGTAPSTSTPTQPTRVGSNFDWVLTNDQDAADGLADGHYAAVLTIPSSFSTSIGTLSGTAQSAVQTLVQVETSPAAALLDPALVQAVTANAAAQLNRQIIDQYLQGVYQGFNSVHDQIAQASTGADQVASGADSVSSGAQQVSSGADSLASGLDSLASASASLPSQAAQLAAGAAQVSSGNDALSGALDNAVSSLADVVTQICQHPGVLCDQVTAALTKLQGAASAAAQLASGADQVATGADQLAAGMPQLVDGIGQASSGASSLAGGASSLVGGAEQESTGADQLATGLAQAVPKIPSYSDSDIQVLSEAASQPVVIDPRSAPSGVQAAPLFTVLALWLGALVLTLVRKPVPESRLLTNASSLRLSLQTAGVTAALGAGQGALLSAVVLIGLGLAPGVWAGYVVASLVLGAVFAVVNQGLAAALGAAGRAIGLLIAVVALAVGVASSVPPAMLGIAAALPTSPALGVLRAAISGDVGLAVQAGVIALLWGVAGLALVLGGVVARRRLRVA
ncbi:YhgE/Pip domain-containing protein [Rathayibacter sp. KR2-224]|uniref:YhgE/Pip domain-containing protein n=1 Tax=Rathayibacter sp. KR2-224 TaxID=3400913 RepID=UPI003C0B9083